MTKNLLLLGIVGALVACSGKPRLTPEQIAAEVRRCNALGLRADPVLEAGDLNLTDIYVSRINCLPKRTGP